MAEKYLPCPCCGAEPKLKYIGNDRTKKRSVEIRCSNLECRLSTSVGTIIHSGFDFCEKHLAKIWNHRPQIKETQNIPDNIEPDGEWVRWKDVAPYIKEAGRTVRAKRPVQQPQLEMPASCYDCGESYDPLYKCQFGWKYNSAACRRHFKRVR